MPQPAEPTTPPGRPGRLGAAALHMARRGWNVFPVRPRSKVPAIPDWANAATTDPDQITAWWHHRPWNIGVAAGRSGLLVLDLDTPKTPTGPDSPRTGGVHPPTGAAAIETGQPPTVGAGTDVTGGLTELRRLVAEAGSTFPWDTFTVRTPSGGRHLYFRQPDMAGLRNTQGALGPLIDTRGHGGYVLAAGSHGPADRHYRVLRDGPVAPLPTWLHDALTAALATPPASGDCCAWSGSGDDPREALPFGLDGPVVSAARIQAYLRAVIDSETRAVSTAAVGTRHTTLLRAARRLGHWVGGRALAQADARAALNAAADGYIGVAGYTARQVDRDITDGLAYGAARPRHIDDLPNRSTHATEAPG